MRKIILFELNEVPFTVIDYFCHKYPHSHLAQTLPYCTQYQTYTEDEGELHPWSTWPTVHRGVSNSQHQLKDFGENLEPVDKIYPPLWKLLQSRHISTGIFASLHSYPMPQNYEGYEFFVPDLFAADSQVHPSHIQPFQNFNLLMSRRSGRNVDSGINVMAATQMLLGLPSLGITWRTIKSLLGQLVQERSRPHVKTRRRTYQSVLAFDIYMKLLRSTQPQFSTFFSNHVASAMHRYWAATFPEDYPVHNLPYQWIQDYGQEIDFAMMRVDEFFQELTTYAQTNPEYQIIMASSMGQVATNAELIKTRTSVKDLGTLLTRLGLQNHDWEPRPAMHPQYNFVVSKNKVSQFSQTLNTFQIGNCPMTYRTKENGFFSLDFGHPNLEIDHAFLNGELFKFEDLGLFNEVMDDESAGTAYHHPEGSLCIFDPQDRVLHTHRESSLTTLAIAPSILENFKVPVPTYMTDQRINEIGYQLGNIKYETAAHYC